MVQFRFVGVGKKRKADKTIGFEALELIDEDAAAQKWKKRRRSKGEAGQSLTQVAVGDAVVLATDSSVQGRFGIAEVTACCVRGSAADPRR